MSSFIGKKRIWAQIFHLVQRQCCELDDREIVVQCLVGRRDFSFDQRSRLALGPSYPLFSDSWGYSSWGVKLTPPSSTKFMNARICTITSHYFM